MAKGEIAADLQSQYATFESSTVTRLPLFRTFLLLDLYLFCSLLAFFILASYHCYDLSLFFLFLYGSVHAAATAAAATAAGAPDDCVSLTFALYEYKNYCEA